MSWVQACHGLDAELARELIMIRLARLCRHIRVMLIVQHSYPHIFIETLSEA